MLETRHENELFNMFSLFSNVVHILGVIPTTFCSAERSFSALRRLKTYGRSTVGQQRVSNIALINICQLCSQKWHGSYHWYLRPSKWLRQLFLLTCFHMYGLCCCIVWPSFLFDCFVKIWASCENFFGQMVYPPPPPAKNCPYAYEDQRLNRDLEVTKPLKLGLTWALECLSAFDKSPIRQKNIFLIGKIFLAISRGVYSDTHVDVPIDL